MLAKPQTDKKSDAPYSYNGGHPPNHLRNPGYGAYAGNPYGNVGAGYVTASGYQQVL